MGSGRNSVIGIGRQTARGSALAAPKFEHFMGGGRIGGTQEIEELPWTSDSEHPAGHYVAGVPIDIELPDLPLLPQSSVPWLKGIVGTLATTGAGPYEHELTSGVADWLSLFWQQPSLASETNKNFITAIDARIGEATIKATGAGPLLLDVTGAARALERAAAKWGAATVVESVTPHFTARDSVHQLDVVGSTLAAFENGGDLSISLSRNLDRWRAVGSLHDDEIDTTKFDIVVEFGEVRPENNDQWNEVMFGSASGTALDADEVYGAYNGAFPLSDGTAMSAAKLEVNLPRLRWAVSPVETDPSGDPITYTLTGTTSQPVSGSAIELIVLNSYAGTAY